MALKEETIVMHRTDESGNKVLQFPITKGDNVEGPTNASKKLVSKLLANGTDLNSLKWEADREYTLYFCNGDAEAKTMLNCPAVHAFTLENIPYNSNGFPIQRITQYSAGNRMWVRSFSTWLDEWQEWREISYMDSNMPNYSAGVSKSWGTLYTAETNGWIYAYRETVQGNYSTQAIVEINGNQIRFHYWNGENGSDEAGIFLPVTKGDTYRVINTGLSQYAIFYPCRG